MDRDQAQPLTPEEAKMQLRHAADRLALSTWVRHRPFGAVITGVLAGFLVGRVPRLWSHISSSGVGQRVFDRFM